MPSIEDDPALSPTVPSASSPFPNVLGTRSPWTSLRGLPLSDGFDCVPFVVVDRLTKMAGSFLHSKPSTHQNSPSSSSGKSSHSTDSQRISSQTAESSSRPSFGLRYATSYASSPTFPLHITRKQTDKRNASIRYSNSTSGFTSTTNKTTGFPSFRSRNSHTTHFPFRDKRIPLLRE